ncbi:MAG: hypothetical protein DMG39_06820 [Acidobacteria bacterium]|nr:MAG: hypothetical protein DMG39_06820 [Acidobacteriota bacterium]
MRHSRKIRVTICPGVCSWLWKCDGLLSLM